MSSQWQRPVASIRSRISTAGSRSQAEPGCVERVADIPAECRVLDHGEDQPVVLDEKTGLRVAGVEAERPGLADLAAPVEPRGDRMDVEE